MNFSRHKVPFLAFTVLISFLVLQSFDASIVSAAGAPTEGYSKILSGFDKNTDLKRLSDALYAFGTGFANIAMVLSVIMTATGAIMVGFGVDDGKKTFWSWILGIGLAINAASVVQALFMGAGGMTWAHPVPKESSFSFAMTGSPGDSNYWNVTGRFLTFYTDDIIYPAAARIVPYACRICLILTCIDISVQIGLQLVEGDKVKFMVSKFIACGMYLFLIANWVGYGDDMGGFHLMDKLYHGMRALGNVAMGNPETPLGTGNIFGDCIAIASAYFGAIDKAGIVMKIFLGLVGIVVCIMLLLIAFETIMAYFEFWTLALLTLPLLAFGVIPQLKFLSESAIKAMFNLGIKCMCIAFLTGVVATTITDYTKTIVSIASDNAKASSMYALASGFVDNVSNSISLLVVVGMMWILVRKMPALIQGLLQGNPSLSAGDMMGTIKSAATTAKKAADTTGNAVGQVMGSYRAARNEAGEGGFGSRGEAVAGTLRNLMKSSVADAIPGINGYRSGNSSIRQSLGRRAGNIKGYKPDEDDGGGPPSSPPSAGGGGGNGGGGGGNPPPPPPPSGSQPFQPKSKDSSLADKAKSAGAGAIGSVAGGKAGAAAGTMAAGPVGGVVGGLAGSAAGDAAGSAAYDAIKSKESGYGSQPSQAQKQEIRDVADAIRRGDHEWLREYNKKNASKDTNNNEDAGRGGMEREIQLPGQNRNSRSRDDDDFYPSL